MEQTNVKKPIYGEANHHSPTTTPTIGTKKESPIEIIHRLLGNDVLPKENNKPKKPEKLEVIKKPSNLDDFLMLIMLIGER